MAEPLLGLLGEFGTGDALLKATREAKQAGYRVIDAFSPYPVEGMAELIGDKKDQRVGWLAVIGGAFGIGSALAVQVYDNLNYPVEVGGRPVIALPAFFVVDFELMILCAVLFCVIGMLAMNHLPRLNHPLFGTPRFSLASDNRFFLYIEAADPLFDPEKTRGFLGSLGAWTVEDVRP